jgi:hydrogenase maturation protein HypF
MTLEFAAEAYETKFDSEALQEEIQRILNEHPQLISFSNGSSKSSGEEAERGDEQAQRFLLPTDELVRLLTEKKLQGESAEKLAYWFHAILAEQIIRSCQRASEQTGLRVCALSGGVFQNQLLLKLCDDRLEAEGFRVLKHSLLPPNDGGIALGQAVAAMAKINREERSN